MTVNVLPSYTDPEDDLAGYPVFIGGSRLTVLWGTNEWGWMGFASPRGIQLTAYLGEHEATHWVDADAAHADGLARPGGDARLHLRDYYRLRRGHPWVHCPPAGRAVCAWFITDYAEIDPGVRAARAIEDYLADGVDRDTLATMIGLATGFAITIRR
jgi:hypothetical protein